MNDPVTEEIMAIRYRPMLRKERRRFSWFLIMFSATGALSVVVTVSGAGLSEWASIMTELVVVGLAWCYYMASTERDVERVKMHGASVLIDGMADELGREWRWIEEFQSFELRDVDEE
jgi:hypothetical protein